LKPGDKIDGGALIVMAAQREAEPATVHNLKVDGQRNYLVGESKAVVRSQDSGSPGADGGVPPSGLDAPDAELGKIVDVEVVNWSKTGDPHDTPYMATVTYQFSDGTKSERTVHTDDLKQVERLVAAAEANRLADQQGAPKPSSDPTARQGQGQDPAARPVAGAPQPRNTAARLAGIRERINVQLALEKTRVRIMEENARRTVIENLPSDHPAYLDPADPALGRAQAKLRELDELRTMLSEDQDVAGSVMRDLSSPGKGPGGSEIAAQEIATPQDMSGPDEATRTDIRPPQRRSADGGHRPTAGEVRRAPTSSAPGVDGRASTPPNPYISGETPVKMSPIERVAWWASQQFPRKQTYSVERYKQLHEAAAPELQERLPKPDTFTADEMTRLLAEVPGGLENLIGDIHAHNRSYAREEGGRYIQKLLLISGRNSRILFGSIPQCCGGDAHYSNANPSPATLRNAKQLDIDAIREFRWMFQTNPALAAKADLSLTGFDFSDRGNMDVVAYGRSHMLEHPGLFPFIGEVTGKKELVSVQLGPFAWDINSPRFQAYLRFANETGQGVLLHYDWGHHTIDGHSEVHGHGRPQGAKTAYENFPELIEVLSRPEYSDVNLIFAHTGIGRFVRPDSTLSPFTRPDGSVIDLPEHIQKLYKLFEAIPNARADISWNDVTQAYADSPHLREGLIAFVIDNQDRLIFGSDTVKPANSGQYHQGLNTGAPMFMELARRNPEAAWKLLRGNYETVLNSAYSRVANWTRRQPEMTNSRIAEMDAMLDTLQSQRQHMAAGARQDFETWLSLVSEAQGRMPDADAKRGAFPYLYESLPDAAHQHWHDDVEIQTGIGTSGGFAQQSPKRRLKGNAIAAATGAAAVAGGMAIDASPGIARIFDPVADGPGGALNAGAFEVRALLIGLRAIHGEALRLEHEAIFENGFVTRKSLDQYVSRIASAQKMLQLSDEKMLRISAATEQFWANYQYLRDMPIDNARGWTQQQRFHAIMAKAGEFIITLDRELGLQTSSVNGLDARRPLGQAMRAVTLGTYLVNDAATLSWLTSDGMDFSTPHGQTEAAYRILFGLGNAALTAHTIGTWSHGMAGRTADASPLMRFLQASGLTSVAMSGIPWTLNDGMRFFDEVVTGDMAGASTAAAATVLDAAFSYYTARAAATNWRGLSGGPMPTNSKIARPLVLLAGALALREIIALEEQASKDDEQRPAGPTQPVNLNGQLAHAQPSPIPAENRPAGTPGQSPDAGAMTFGTQAEEQGKATAQPGKAAPQDAKTPSAATDAKAATPPMPSRRDAGIAPRRDAAPQPKASPADARQNAPQTERKRVGAAGGDAGVDVRGVQRR
jgi:hypothetical protein